VRRYICREEWSSAEHRYYYSMTLMGLQYVAPLLVLVFTYARIGVVIWGKRTPGEAHNGRDQRMARSKRKVVALRTVCSHFRGAVTSTVSHGMCNVT